MKGNGAAKLGAPESEEGQKASKLCIQTPMSRQQRKKLQSFSMSALLKSKKQHQHQTRAPGPGGAGPGPRPTKTTTAC